MSDYKLISPLLDGFAMGGPISEHNGIACCPAMPANSDDKYIVKIISVPASQRELDALLLSGAYRDASGATEYFKLQAEDIVKETMLLKQLAKADGFLPYANYQVVPKEGNDLGYDVYLIGTYKYSLEKHLTRNGMTHLAAVNLGLDLCAAMSICRRAGYLYVAAKPTNVFIVNEREYRIGDLGFAPMASLKYSSMPSRYRSSYTPPELHDAMATLNPTADTYAVGMMLYRIYNNGKLPFKGRPPMRTLPAPANADSEMAEIILKACAANPRKRYQNPVEMGKDLVSYLQRNVVNNDLIMPPQAAPVVPMETSIGIAMDSAKEVPVLEPIIMEEAAEETPVTENLEEVAPVSEVIPEAAEPVPEVIPEVEAEPEVPEVPAGIAPEEDEAAPIEEPNADSAEEFEEDAPETGEEELLPAEDDEAAEDGEAAEADEEAPAEADFDADTAEDAVPEDLSQLLDDVNSLLTEEIPEDSLPAEAAEEAEEDTQADADAEESLPEATEEAPDDDADETEDAEDAASETVQPVEAPKKKHKIWGWLIGLLVIAGLGCGGFFFYQSYYLVELEAWNVSSFEDTVTVTIDDNLGNLMLTATCTDTYGNSMTKGVVNGSATFSSLASDMLYRVTLNVDGFHKMSGNFTQTVSTAPQLRVMGLTATTGNEEGSAVVSINVEDGDDHSWQIDYAAEGEEPRTTEFTGNMVTVSGLTMGQVYTFQLRSTEEGSFMVGIDSVDYLVVKPVIPTNLEILSFADGVLIAQWVEPEDAADPLWTVRCYSENGTDLTQEITGNTVTFRDLTPDASYTVEVVAGGMAQGARAFVSANPTSVSDLRVDDSDASCLNVSWTSNGNVPEDGWLLMYALDGTDFTEVVKCSSSSGKIEQRVPGAVYAISVQAADGSTVFGGKLEYACPDAPVFDAYALHAGKIQSNLAKTPDKENWTHKDITSNDYTSEFDSEQSISMVLYSEVRFYLPSDEIRIQYVIRNSDGQVLADLVKCESRVWSSMWDGKYTVLTIPALPTEAGDYSVTVNFNGAKVLTKDFTIK